MVKILIIGSACIYLPIYALVSLFIHLLKAPSSDSAPSDIVMTEIAAGFFARLEFATDAVVCIPFLKEVPRYARHVVERAKCNTVPTTAQKGGQQHAIDSALTIDERRETADEQDVSLGVSKSHLRRESDFSSIVLKSITTSSSLVFS